MNLLKRIMKNKQSKIKVFSGNFYFLLPEDFKGSFEDAFLEVLKFQISESYKNGKSKMVLNETKLDDDTNTFDKFLLSIFKGKKLFGNFGLNQFNFKSQKWKNIYKGKKDV